MDEEEEWDCVDFSPYKIIKSQKDLDIENKNEKNVKINLIIEQNRRKRYGSEDLTTAETTQESWKIKHML